MKYEAPPPPIDSTPPQMPAGGPPQRSTQAFPPAARGRFTPAVKAGSRLRCAMYGPAGSGKTYTALRIATGMGGRIAVIDTERGTSRKYADRFTFDVCELNARRPEDYIDVIKAAGASGYDVLITDSLSHAWQELLGENDRIAQAKFKGNTWAAWQKSTPKHNALIDALMDSRCHLIVTLRSKTEWTTGATASGGSKPIRVGLAPEQRKGIEYEFDLLMELNVEHVAEVVKDRTGKFQDQFITKPDETFGAALAAWLMDQPFDGAWGGGQGGSQRVDGSPPAPAPPLPTRKVY